MSKASVLCVDDEPMVLRTTEMILRNVGYAVSTAANASDAFQLLKTEQFNLLLLDCIPDRGWVVQEAKRVNPNIRVVVFTGDRELGELPLVDIVLHKPALPRDLIKKIAKLLATPAAA